MMPWIKQEDLVMMEAFDKVVVEIPVYGVNDGEPKHKQCYLYPCGKYSEQYADMLESKGQCICAQATAFLSHGAFICPVSLQAGGGEPCLWKREKGPGTTPSAEVEDIKIATKDPEED